MLARQALACGLAAHRLHVVRAAAGDEGGHQPDEHAMLLTEALLERHQLAVDRAVESAAGRHRGERVDGDAAVSGGDGEDGCGGVDLDVVRRARAAALDL